LGGILGDFFTKTSGHPVCSSSETRHQTWETSFVADNNNSNSNNNNSKKPIRNVLGETKFQISEFCWNFGQAFPFEDH
jgi:hypothetical protein